MLGKQKEEKNVTCVCDLKDTTEFKRKKKAYNVSFHLLHSEVGPFWSSAMPFHGTEAVEIGQMVSFWSLKTDDQIRASNLDGVL